jgi:hypothetical protein
MSYKLLIASGCSFTDGSNSWPYQLSQELNCDVKNYGLLATGNGRISRSIIYGVTEALKSYKPEELLVGIIWSGKSRLDFFRSNVDTNNVNIEKSKNYNWNVGNFKSPDGSIPLLSNRFIEGADKNWFPVHVGFDNTFTEIYYKYFQDDMNDEILTLEHILRTQWFLKMHNIKYFMGKYSDNVLSEVPNINTQHLYDLLDRSTFLKIKNYQTWCFQSRIPFADKDLHPTVEHHIEFAKKVLVPFVNNL